jgi:hypothetical protein
MIETIRRLRKLEDIEAAVHLPDGNILNEMSRIGQRQFHWQRGYLNMPQIYRYPFLYGQGRCADYFHETYGLSITDFVLAGFAAYSAYQGHPWLARTAQLPEFGLTNEIFQQALKLLTISDTDARSETDANARLINEQHGNPLPTAYVPGILRRHPLAFMDENPNLFIAPINELILYRITAGLYYDLRSGGQELLNEANDRFESYSASLMEKLLPQAAVARSTRYGRRGAQWESPDVVVRHDGKITIVAECKATKLTYLAQFAEDPFGTEKKQYAQVGRGIFQLWRYFSHIRRGILAEQISDDPHAMVITLDPFLTMNRELRKKVVEHAQSLADEEGDILDEDRKQVIFCPIADLEGILVRATDELFLATLMAARDDRYDGWDLREVHKQETRDQQVEEKDYPFAMQDVLPWWALIPDAVEAARAPSPAL